MIKSLRFSPNEMIKSDTNWYLKLKAEGAPIEMQNGKVILLAQITQREDPESGDSIYIWESDQ